jgi:hypothetical protein
LTEEARKENTQETSPGNGNQFVQIVAEKEREIAALKKSEGELKEKLSAVSKSLTAAVVRYKDRLVQLNPEITEELISGDTIEAVDNSLEKAINLIGRVKKSVEKEISHIKVPAGAPGRRIPDLSTLSPREKIQYAIGGKK